MAGKQITLLDDAQWPTNAFAVNLPIRPESAALGVIDVQRYATDPDGPLAHSVALHNEALMRDFKARFDAMLVNIRKLLAAFRGAGRRVFHTRHGMHLPDGMDLVERRRGREKTALKASDDRSGHLPVRGEKAHEILPDVAPEPGELVLDKNTSSAFHTTPVDLFLRNMQVETLVLAGFAADQCVFATALDAADRGFHVIIAHDACANLDPGNAEAVQILFGRVWGYVMSTDDIIEWLKTGTPPARTRLPV